MLKFVARFFVGLLFWSNCSYGLESQDIHFVVVIPSYNNARWCLKNISSVLDQTSAVYRVIYINDASTDNTFQCVEKCLQEKGIDYKVISYEGGPNLGLESIEYATRQVTDLVNQDPAFFTVINNTCRSGALQNLYHAIYSCENNEVIVTLDGDDWFPHAMVLEELTKVYEQENVWLTHGNLQHYPDNGGFWCEPVPTQIIANNSFRTFKCPSHLRTFYAWLFKRIKTEDLLYGDKFFSMTWDMAMMYPMIEMTGERHAFISRFNYVYNTTNEINDNKVDPEWQRFLDKYIRSLPPYTRINDE